MSLRPRAPFGLALIVVVGVLGVLAVLATAFVTMARLERKASLQRLNAAKAYLLARSGVEDALARLGVGQDPQIDRNRYGGEDWDNSGGPLSAFEAQQEVYEPGKANVDDCPVRQAMRPSFFVGDNTGMPKYRSVDGRQRGYSGTLTGDYVRDGNQYALKMSSGGFYVNGGDPSHRSYPTDPTATTDYNTTLRFILGTLADAIDREDNKHDGKPVGIRDGWKLIDRRPPTGWTSYDQIRDVAFATDPSAVRQIKIETLKPYLTLSTWVDKHVITPNATAAMIAKGGYSSWADIKLAHDAYPVTAPGTRYAPDFERIPVAATGKLVGRAPVELAWARTRPPALIALIAGLRGVYLDETAASTPTKIANNAFGGHDPAGDYVGVIRDAQLALDWTQPTDDCRTAVSAILTSASDLSTWQQFNDFCDTIPFTATGSTPAATSDLRQAMRDILKANFNPNSDLNKMNPNPSSWKSVDKSDLLSYSTEFSLFPSGTGQVDSVGRVLGKNGNLLASRALEAEVSKPGVVRIATQKEFVCDDLGDLDTPGDEASYRLPGSPTFVTESQGSGKTWGQALDLRSRYPGSWMDGTAGDRGASIQTYPEPCFDVVYPDTGASLAIAPADYAGNLQLAATETPTGDIDTVTATTHVMMLLARFTDGLDLDVAAAYKPGMLPDPRLNQVDARQVSTPQLSTSVMGQVVSGGGLVNTLYPDGCYSEKDRCPSYLDKGNANGFNGVMSFWVKPNYRSVAMRGRQYVGRTHYRTAPDPDQFFVLGDVDINNFYAAYNVAISTLMSDRCFYFHFEPARHLSNATESLFTTSDRTTKAHAWQLLTSYWDEAASWSDRGEVRVNSGGASQGPDLGTIHTYTHGPGDTVSPPDDLTMDESLGPHRTALGALRGARTGVWGEEFFVGGGADATFAEAAIYDFGEAKASAGQLAGSRYAEGRYYKGGIYKAADAPVLPIVPDEAASYFTAPIHLPTGAMLQEIAWTWLRSSDALLAQDYAQVELVIPAGNQYLWPGSISNGVADGAKQVWTVNQVVPGDFRARVLFLRPLPPPLGAGPDLSNTPILDSPVFDDMTFIYTPVGGSRILAWGDGE